MIRAASSSSDNSTPARRPSSVSFSTKMSTSASNSPDMVCAGAGLSSVVAPAARARRKKAAIVGSGISNWLTATSPFVSGTDATSSTPTSALLPGMTTMVLSASATVMMAVPVCASAVSLIEPGSMPCALRNVLSSAPNASVPSRPISVVFTPSRDAATAWFAPFPPGKYSTCRPATVSPTLGWRSAVATTSMLMLPAIKTRPMICPYKTLDPDFELVPDFGDVHKGRQPGLVAEALDLEGRGGAGKIKMLAPAFAGMGEVGIDIGAVEDVAGAVGVDHALARDRHRRHDLDRTRLIVPEQALLTHGDAADLAAAALEVVEHLLGRQVHLLTQAFGDDGDVDECEQLMRVGAQAAAVERGQDSGLAADLCIVDRGIGLMAVDVQGATATEIEHRERMDVLVVAAADDGALTVLGHDEGQRGLVHLPPVQRDRVFRAHVLEHPPQPVIGRRGDEIGHDAELGAAERRRDRVAAEGDRVVRCHVLFVAGRHVVGDEDDVDIGLTDKESLHWLSVMR